jgi:hypothetical protein
MRLGLLMLAVSLLFAGGCRNTAGSQTAPNGAPRVIIGFDEKANPPGNELLSTLGRELGCELQFLQAIGGNAYVYQCLTADKEEALARKLEALGRHKGVHYAEIDRIRKIRN